jgi:hypothetical protein
LTLFDVEDHHWGAALDIGRYEAGFVVVAEPTSQAIDVAGVARYVLYLYPPDLPHAVALTLPSPPAGLSYDPSSSVLAAALPVTLTVTHDGSPQGQGEWLTVSITGTGGGFVQSAEVLLLVGGYRVYFPLVSSP